MDSVNSPQANTPQEVPPTTPAVQEAEATLKMSKINLSSLPKPFLIGLLILFVLIFVGIVGNYFLILKYTNDASIQTVPTTTTTTTDTPKIIASPTPKSEQDAVDQLDTTFPTSEVNGIQTDLQAL